VREEGGEGGKVEVEGGEVGKDEVAQRRGNLLDFQTIRLDRKRDSTTGRGMGYFLESVEQEWEK
jgi:hypothetical protein